MDQQLFSPATVHSLTQLPLTEREVWQVSVLKLHGWGEATVPPFPDCPEEARVCRPYCLFLANLYPMSRAFLQKMCTPPDAFPTAEWVLNTIIAKMKEPTDGTTPRRPQCVVFSSVQLAAECFNSLKAVGIDCSQLLDAPDIVTVVRSVSEHFVKKNMLASVGDPGERPGTGCSEPAVPYP